MKQEVAEALDNLVHWQGFDGKNGPQEAADTIRKYIEELEGELVLQEIAYRSALEALGDSG